MTGRRRGLGHDDDGAHHHHGGGGATGGAEGPREKREVVVSVWMSDVCFAVSQFDRSAVCRLILVVVGSLGLGP